MTEIDEKNPEQKIFESSNKKIYISSAMFPEEISFKFKEAKPVKSIFIESKGIKKIAVQTSEDDTPDSFKTQAEQNEIPEGTGLQNIKVNLPQNPVAQVIKIEFIEGYDETFSIHNVDIQ